MITAGRLQNLPVVSAIVQGLKGGLKNERCKKGINERIFGFYL